MLRFVRAVWLALLLAVPLLAMAAPSGPQSAAAGHVPDDGSCPLAEGDQRRIPSLGETRRNGSIPAATGLGASCSQGEQHQVVAAGGCHFANAFRRRFFRLASKFRHHFGH